jgi:ParB-like nuclease domain
MVASARVSPRSRATGQSPAVLRVKLGQLEVGLVPVVEIAPHEKYARDHEQSLAKRIDQAGFLANPIIVADSGSGRFILLDGTHRLEYMRAKGLASAPVQIVRLHVPASVDIATWCHRVADADLPALLHGAAADGLSVTPASASQAMATLRAGAGLAALTVAPDEAVIIDGAPWHDALRRLVRLYGAPERVADAPEFDSASSGSKAQEQALLVAFRAITPAAIEGLVQAGKQIPAGITRVLLPGGRVLGLKTPLDLLEAGASTVRQMDWLDDVGHTCPVWYLNGGVVFEPGPRLYEEPLTVFDADLDVQPRPMAGPVVAGSAA